MPLDATLFPHGRGMALQSQNEEFASNLIGGRSEISTAWNRELFTARDIFT
jgi:hypothetical protein